MISIRSIGSNGDINYRNELLEYHREDGPAIERVDGDKYWYINDKLHRLDGPAEERSDGTKLWWVNGKQHRLDGPAMELISGTKYWFYKGTRIFCKSQKEFEKIIRLIAFY